MAGLVDAFASFHGARMLEPGDAIDVGGAAGGFGVYWDRPVQVRGGFTTPAPLPDRWSVGAAMAATGAALDWLAGDVLGGADVTALIRAEADAVPAGAEGLVFLPYLAGERSPLWDPSARGAFAGLTLRHGRAHLVRAILEAAAFAIRHVAEPMLDAGIDGQRDADLRRAGAVGRRWNQLKADVTGFTVEVPRVRETADVGAAIVAAVGVGAHPDLPAAIRRHDRDRSTLRAGSGGRRVTYDRAYEAYSRSVARDRPDRPPGRGGSRGDERHRPGPRHDAVASWQRPARISLRGVTVSFAADRRAPRGPRGSSTSTIEPRPDRGAHRPERQRQVDAAAGRRRPAADRTGAQVALDGQAIVGPDPRIGLVFQEPRLLPWRTTASNIAYPLELAGVDRRPRGARVAELLGPSAWKRPRRRSRRSSRAACASAPHSRGRSPSSPRCCCSTSRSARSTSSPGSA